MPKGRFLTCSITAPRRNSCGGKDAIPSTSYAPVCSRTISSARKRRRRSSRTRWRMFRPRLPLHVKAPILTPRKPLRDSTFTRYRSHDKVAQKQERSANVRQITYLQAIGEAMREEMRRDSRVFLMGEDIEANVFGTATGFKEEFGADPLRDAPLAEAGFVGAAIGSAMGGMRPIVDLTIASFLYVAMDQIVSMAAKTTYMYGGQTRVPLVLRASMFFGGANAAQHSDRNYPMFMNVPGLKIIAPSTPYDMKGLLKTAIREDDPVISFEAGMLWGARGEVPEER